MHPHLAGIAVLDVDACAVARNGLALLEEWAAHQPQLGVFVVIEREHASTASYGNVRLIGGPRVNDVAEVGGAFEYCEAGHLHYQPLCSPATPCESVFWLSAMKTALERSPDSGAANGAQQGASSRGRIAQSPPAAGRPEASAYSDQTRCCRGAVAAAPRPSCSRRRSSPGIGVHGGSLLEGESLATTPPHPRIVATNLKALPHDRVRLRRFKCAP